MRAYPQAIVILLAGLNIATFITLLVTWRRNYWAYWHISTYATLTVSCLTVLMSIYRFLQSRRWALLSNGIEVGALAAVMVLWLLWPPRWVCLAGQALPTDECFVTIGIAIATGWAFLTAAGALFCSLGELYVYGNMNERVSG